MRGTMGAMIAAATMVWVCSPASMAAPACCAKDAGTINCGPSCSGSCAGCAGMKLGTQAYTFRLFTFFEAVDKAKQLGLDFIEVFPGQQVSKDMGDAKMGPDLTMAQMARIKNKLDEAGIRAIGYGVAGLGKDEAENRKVFDFAKVMGITTITAEPPEDSLELIDRLANEYQINVAIHNHPKPSHYWNPDTVLKAIKNCSKRIGACADTGHWVRSGLDPLECLRQLEGRILWSHFKDLNEKNPNAHDVPWGTGVCNAKALVTELHRQGFKGGVMAEYEHNWENSVPDLAKCAEFFTTTYGELVKQAKAKETAQEKEDDKQQ
ncbi:MAG: sugar phosphate isomerase/epimerase [Phycisphaerae bacterium]|nr:sugar phosphate isomerase/epimerase [Phycisphaerae bacterium]